jgi:predicted Zn-dependent protease
MGSIPVILSKWSNVNIDTSESMWKPDDVLYCVYTMTPDLQVWTKCMSVEISTLANIGQTQQPTGGQYIEAKEHKITKKILDVKSTCHLHINWPKEYKNKKVIGHQTEPILADIQRWRPETLAIGCFSHLSSPSSNHYGLSQITAKHC